MKVVEYRKRKEREERERRKKEQEVRELEKRFLEEIRQNPTTETVRRARERMKELEKQEKWLKRQEKNIDSAAKEVKKKITEHKKVVSEGAKRAQKRRRERLAQKSQNKEGGLIEKAGAVVTDGIDEIAIKIPESVDNAVGSAAEASIKKIGEVVSIPTEKRVSSESNKEKIDSEEQSLAPSEDDMDLICLLERKKKESKKQAKEQLDFKFRELMKEYYVQTKKKADHGLKITKKFKKWLKDKSFIDEKEKKQLLEYCNYYEKQLPKVKLEKLKEIVRQHHEGGEILSPEYVNNYTKIKCRCAEGHVWEAMPYSVKEGHWCLKCSGKKKGLRQKSSLEELKEIVRQQHEGGEILSPEYVNNRTKVKCRCEDGHIWEITPDNLKQDRWCPVCNIRINEQICQKTFQMIFNKEFPKSRPNWLVNDRGNQMELDGYNKEIAIAFEYQGEQHYQYHKFFHKSLKDFEERKANDKLKKELCEKNGITLIEVPYTVEYNQMQDYIINECKKKNVDIPEIDKKIDYKELNISSYKFKELRKYVRQHHEGGEILSSEYINNRTKITIRCEKGHVWEITPSNLKQGHWCPQCSAKEKTLKPKERQRALEVLRKYVRHHHEGGEILSPEYVNNHTKVKCRCVKGHEWEAIPNSIKSGTWCPKCAIRERVRKRKMSGYKKKKNTNKNS
ncbi:MAG: hypothetical protein HWN66_06335 [Candidatus Helarchaeota archaeon]|nr:hypothetical protein [Candidatus Helarchaeota archaeon]